MDVLSEKAGLWEEDEFRTYDLWEAVEELGGNLEPDFCRDSTRMSPDSWHAIEEMLPMSFLSRSGNAEADPDSAIPSNLTPSASPL